MKILYASPSAETAPAVVEYLNLTAATCSAYRGQRIHDGYRYLATFFRSPLFDRTGTLDPGFRYRIVDPIPQPRPDLPPLNALCDARGRELLALARASGDTINVLWSGGIDSTTALTALLKAAKPGDELKRLRVFYSRHSVREYRRFFREVIAPTLSHRKITDIGQALDAEGLLVTGELGDQIFGSMLAADYLREKRWFRAADRRLLEPYPRAFPAVLRQRLNRAQALAAQRFLQPQLAHSPVPLATLFDLLWWVNFSMKWQPVSQRLAAYRPDRYGATLRRLYHFFRTDDFQRWSVACHDDKIDTTWPSYKLPLKRYIHDCFPDPDYLASKTKEVSLTRVVRSTPQRVTGASDGAAPVISLTVSSGRGDSCADDGGE